VIFKRLTLVFFLSPRFPDEPNIRYIVVSGFIFLRFFCPAILGPKLFGLREDVPDNTIGRTLTMVAKVLQNLANIVDFGQKEPYLIDLNPFISENKERMKTFIDALAFNRDSTTKRIEEMEQKLLYEEKVFEGVDNLHKMTKSDRKQRTVVAKELSEIKDRLDAIKQEQDRLKRIRDTMPVGMGKYFGLLFFFSPLSNFLGSLGLGGNFSKEYDYSGKFNFDVESDMARLHGHLAAKRDATIAMLESVGSSGHTLTAKKFAAVLDELDELLERLQRNAT